MNLFGTPLKRGVLATLFAASVLPAFALKYNDPGTTNYIGWTTNDTRLKVGVDEADVTLFVTNGGYVVFNEVYVGENSTSTSNLLAVTGGGVLLAGNVDTNNLSTGGIAVGDTSGKGLLRIDNASEVSTDYLHVGLGSNETGKVEVQGDGLLRIENKIYVGSSANSNNVVSLKDGGALFVNEVSDLVIANKAGATNHFNEVNVESAGRLLVGGDVNATGVTGTSNLNFKAGAVLGVGGTLTIDDSAIENSLNIVLDDALGTNTAAWNTAEIYVGDSTAKNSLTITNGASATASDILYVGNKSTATDNFVAVGGSNSILVAKDKLLVGASGKRNALELSDGGAVVVALDLKAGVSSGADGNTIAVGTNAVLGVGGSVVVGDFGAANEFNIDGGQVAVTNDVVVGASSRNNRYNQTYGTNVVGGSFIIGKNKAAGGTTGSVNATSDPATTGNRAIVGTGATLEIAQNLTVGKEGSGSILTVRDGGIVNVAGDTVIGEAVKDNYIYLQRDADTRFNVAGDLVVGKKGGSNRFAVYGGTANIGGDLLLGSGTEQHESKNFIHLETTNAVLNVANALHVGASNSVNTLDIVAGAIANAQDLFVGTYAGVSNNIVTVTGKGSLLNITNNLAIGSATGTNNAVDVKSGGTLYVGNTISLAAGTNGVGSSLTIGNGGTLKTLGWDFSGMDTNIVFQGGSALHLLGSLFGTNEVEGGLAFILDGTLGGTNTAWNTGTNALVVGRDTDRNSLTLTNGAMAATATNLYIGIASKNNRVVVDGTGSLLDIGGNLSIGTETNTSTLNFFGQVTGSNTLEILSGGLVKVGGDADLFNGATLRIDSISRMDVAGDYNQDSRSTLAVGVSTNQAAPNLNVAGRANLSTGSKLFVFNDGIGKNDTNVVQNVVVAGELTIDDQAASTRLLLDRVTIATNLLLGFNVTVSNGTAIVLDNFIVRSIGEAAGLDGQVLAVAGEIESLRAGGDPAASNMYAVIQGLTDAEANQALRNFYGEKESSVPSHNVINMGIQSVAERLTMRADNTRARMGMASAADTAPQGAGGPHMPHQELQGWLTGYGTWSDKKAADGFNGYEGSLGGFLIGADASVADNVLVGVAGGSGSGSIDGDNGSSTDTRTTHIAGYLSMGTKDWFGDASIIYGGSSVDSTLGTTFDTKAQYDAQNIAFYVGGGKELIGNYLVFTPQASLLANYYKQDGYTEKASNAVGRQVDSFDTLYVQGAVGGSLALYTSLGEMSFKPEIRAFWLHEFNAKEEDLAYMLIGGTGSYNLQLQAPEEDILKLGVGLSTKLGEYLELRADLDGRWGSDYSDHTLLGSIRYQF